MSFTIFIDVSDRALKRHEISCRFDKIFNLEWLIPVATA